MQSTRQEELELLLTRAHQGICFAVLRRKGLGNPCLFKLLGSLLLGELGDARSMWRCHRPANKLAKVPSNVRCWLEAHDRQGSGCPGATPLPPHTTCVPSSRHRRRLIFFGPHIHGDVLSIAQAAKDQTGASGRGGGARGGEGGRRRTDPAGRVHEGQPAPERSGSGGHLGGLLSHKKVRSDGARWDCWGGGLG